MRTGTSIPITTKIILAFLAFLVLILIFLMLVRFEVVSINLPAFGKGDQIEIALPADDANQLVVEINKETELYSGPGENYKTIGIIENSAQVSVLGKSLDGNWLAIGISTDKVDVGWIKANSVIDSFVDNSSKGSLDGTLNTGEPTVVADSDVDVYNGPGVRYEVLGRLLENQEAQVVGVSSNHDWWLIRYPYSDKDEGWVAASSVTARNVEGVQIVQNEGQQSPDELATVTAVTNINIRSGPGTGYDILGKFEVGQIAVVVGISTDGKWWYIDVPSPDISRGWVSTAYVKAENTANVPSVGADGAPVGKLPTPEITSKTPSLTAYVNLNIRSGPGVSFDVIGVLEKQTRVEVLGVNDDGLWWAIKFPEGADGRGWVSGQYVVTSNVDNVPILKK